MGRTRNPEIARKFLLCLPAVTVLACGCGARPAAGPPESTTISILGFAPDAGVQLREDALDQFTRDSGIAVDLIPTAGNSAEQLALTLRLLRRSDRAPDVYVTDVIWPGTLSEYLMDLTPYADGEAQSHLPALLRNDTVNGRLVSLPFYLTVGMLYYRSDLLHRYGYDRPPDNWDELESMAARIQKRERAAGNSNFWGYVWQGSAYEGLTCNALEWQAGSGGGRIVEPDGTISVNNPRSAAAFERAARWIGTISPRSVLSYTESDSLSSFCSGNAAFLRYWSAGFPPGCMNDPKMKGRMKIALLPAGSRGRAQIMGGFHLAVSRHSSHPREAARLVRFLAGREVQLRRALRRGYLPTIPRLYEYPALVNALPHAGMLKKVGVSSWLARPSSVTGARYREVSQAYYQAVHAILSGDAHTQTALAGLEQQLVRLTGFRVGRPQP